VSDKLDGLRTAVEVSPENHALRLVLAEALEQAGEAQEALDHFAVLLGDGKPLPRRRRARGRERAHRRAA
jgi:thioredoxin-like negative regulator of GroEL